MKMDLQTELSFEKGNNPFNYKLIYRFFYNIDSSLLQFLVSFLYVYSSISFYILPFFFSKYQFQIIFMYKNSLFSKKRSRGMAFQKKNIYNVLILHFKTSIQHCFKEVEAWPLFWCFSRALSCLRFMPREKRCVWNCKQTLNCKTNGYLKRK